MIGKLPTISRIERTPRSPQSILTMFVQLHQEAMLPSRFPTHLANPQHSGGNLVIEWASDVQMRGINA